MKKTLLLILGLISMISTVHAKSILKLDHTCRNSGESLTSNFTYKINGHKDLEIKGDDYADRKISVFIQRNLMPYRAQQLIDTLTATEKGTYAYMTISCESTKANKVSHYEVEIKPDYSQEDDEDEE